MENLNKIKNLKKELESRKIFFEKCLEAWQQVKRVSKKDGSDFVAIGKNFGNAKYEKETWGAYSFSLKVHYYCDGKTQEDDICCYECIDILCKDERKKAVAINRGCGLHPVYLLTVDEIFEKIEEKKQYLIEKINKVNEELKKIEVTENEANQLLNNVIDFLKKHKNDELCYTLQDAIKDNIYFY